MLSNYFKIALRNIKRYTIHSVLNVSGLAIGMACAILLLLFVKDELSYDRFRKNGDRLYRVLERQTAAGKITEFATTPFPLVATLKEKYPEIIRATRYYNTWNSFPKGDDFVGGTLGYVDKDFIKMFEIEVVHGNLDNALQEPNDIVITQNMAIKYFGNENAVGKAMTVSPGSFYTVKAVIKEQPRNSFIYINCLVSIDNLRLSGIDLNSWKEPKIAFTFIEFTEGSDTKKVENEIKNSIPTSVKESKSEVLIQNIKRIRLYSQGKYEGDYVNSNIIYIKISVIVAVLILLIACINFMNLSIALSSNRTREIGVRKLAGASNRKIALQFFGESILIVFIAHILAMILVELFLPGFNKMLFKNLSVDYRSVGLYIGLVIIVLFCGLIAGSYPALYLSSLKPVIILKNAIHKSKGKIRFRKSIVITQFTMSFLFVICTLVIILQLRFMQNKDLGLKIDNVCYFAFNDIRQENIKSKLINKPGIISVTNTSEYALFIKETASIIEWEGKKGMDENMNVLYADPDFEKTFQPLITKGRFISTEFVTDSTSVVINESAAEIIDFEDPLGKEITLNGIKSQIVGVIKDFHFQPLRSKISPLIIASLPRHKTSGICNIRVQPGNDGSALNEIRNVLKSYNLSYPVNIGFIDFDYKSTYMVEGKISLALGYVTLLSIIISCLGLIGLSTLMTIRRTKEIGIRKSNGAKAREILTLLLKEYTSLTTIAFVVASPVAWFLMKMWLQGYAYRINMGPGLFIMAWIIVIAITILTVGLQTIRAAGKNPVDALRYE